MVAKQEKQKRVKVKRIQIRGDEVAILFFSLVFLAFLFISFFRLFAVGKLFDDFLFTFLFGWTKYLVYGFLFVILLPIFFNFYFRIKVTFIIGAIFTFFILSWFVQNISILVTNKNQVAWTEWYFYRFDDLSAYFYRWWDTTIINNYYGFFAQPISFTDWNNVATFFPTYATGGIVANFLIYTFAFGGFVTVLSVSSCLLFVGLTWTIFGKPWFFFLIIFFFLLPIINLIKKQRINRISEKSLAHKQKLDEIEIPIQQPPAVKNNNSRKLTPEPVKSVVKKKLPSNDIVLQDVIQESGTLAPFGQVGPKKPKDEEEDN